MENLWHSLSRKDVYNKLKAKEEGLSLEEVEARLSKFGFNELPKKEKNSVLKIFLKQFTSPLELLLVGTMIISFLIQETVDGFAILFIILVDSLLGTFQEWKAEKTKESLQKIISVKTSVIRNKEKFLIDSKYLVPGDIVLLESGNRVCADLRILECDNLLLDEATLTGESEAIYKDSGTYKENTILAERKNMVYAGTNVLTGRAKCLVVATGKDTEVGHIAERIKETKQEKSPLTIRMEMFAKQISGIILGVVIFLTGLLLMKNMPINEVLLSVIALSVSAMPEGLSLALTMALTIASNKMSKKNVIVKNLNSVESLGSCTVIASDKTGTLTVNEQTAKRIVLPNDASFEISGVGYLQKGEVTGPKEFLKDAKLLSKMGVLNNEGTFVKKDRKNVPLGDSIDIAFLVLGKKFQVKIDNCEVVKRIPYESEKKYSLVCYQEKKENICTIKGSFEVILDYCKDMEFGGKRHSLDIEKLERQNDSLAKDGYRVIALAYKEMGKNDSENIEMNGFHFLGFVAFIDPVREEVKDSIKECKNAGIKVLMITGDHPKTAFKIATDLEIVNDYTEVATGVELDEYLEKGQKEFDEFVKNKCVFTRTTPIHKLEIVESFKRSNEFIAVTGDGVNDAPALKAANIGIAMGSGTDVAKDVSSLIILDDNFKSIVAGVKEGRIAYSNIRKISYLLLSCGFAEVLFFVLAIFLGLPLPLVAVQLLWLNIVTDGLQDLALSFEKGDKNIMKTSPRNPNESIFNKELFNEVLISGVTIGLLVFITFFYLLKRLNMDISIVRGFIMTLMVFIQNMHVLNCRSEMDSIFKVPLSKNYFILFAIVSACLLQILVNKVEVFRNILQSTDLSVFSMFALFLLSTTILIVMEFYKYIKRNNKRV